MTFRLHSAPSDGSDLGAIPEPRHPHAESRPWLEPVRAALAARLARRERGLLAAVERPESSRPVFVLGPPRSGTTLLYELLVTRFRFAYVSRAAQAVWAAPAAATRLARPAIRRWRGDYRSRYGQLRGWGAPHEAVRVWARWMPGEGALSAEDIEPNAADDCRRTVAAISTVLDAPFLSKNPTHSVRIRLLAALFPSAAFIELKRDDVTTVRSILAMRRAWHGPARMHEWMAVRPRGVDPRCQRQVDPVVQVCRQVIETRRDIAADIATAAPGRLLTVSYESLCADPRATLGAIAGFLERHGTVLDARGAVPDRFEIASPTRARGLDGATTDDDAIARALATLQPSAAPLRRAA